MFSGRWGFTFIGFTSFFTGFQLMVALHSRSAAILSFMMVLVLMVIGFLEVKERINELNVTSPRFNRYSQPVSHKVFTVSLQSPDLLPLVESKDCNLLLSSQLI